MANSNKNKDDLIDSRPKREMSDIEKKRSIEMSRDFNSKIQGVEGVARVAPMASIEAIENSTPTYEAPLSTANIPLLRAPFTPIESLLSAAASSNSIDRIASVQSLPTMEQQRPVGPVSNPLYTTSLTEESIAMVQPIAPTAGQTAVIATLNQGSISAISSSAPIEEEGGQIQTVMKPEGLALQAIVPDVTVAPIANAGSVAPVSLSSPLDNVYSSNRIDSVSSLDTTTPQPVAGIFNISDSPSSSKVETVSTTQGIVTPIAIPQAVPTTTGNETVEIELEVTPYPTYTPFQYPEAEESEAPATLGVVPTAAATLYAAAQASSFQSNQSLNQGENAQASLATPLSYITAPTLSNPSVVPSSVVISTPNVLVSNRSPEKLTMNLPFVNSQNFNLPTEQLIQPPVSILSSQQFIPGQQQPSSPLILAPTSVNPNSPIQSPRSSEALISSSSFIADMKSTGRSDSLLKATSKPTVEEKASVYAAPARGVAVASVLAPNSPEEALTKTESGAPVSVADKSNDLKAPSAPAQGTTLIFQTSITSPNRERNILQTTFTIAVQPGGVVEVPPVVPPVTPPVVPPVNPVVPPVTPPVVPPVNPVVPPVTPPVVPPVNPIVPPVTPPIVPPVNPIVPPVTPPVVPPINPVVPPVTPPVVPPVNPVNPVNPPVNPVTPVQPINPAPVNNPPLDISNVMKTGSDGANTAYRINFTYEGHDYTLYDDCAPDSKEAQLMAEAAAGDPNAITQLEAILLKDSTNFGENELNNGGGTSPYLLFYYPNTLWT